MSRLLPWHQHQAQAGPAEETRNRKRAFAGSTRTVIALPRGWSKACAWQLCVKSLGLIDEETRGVLELTEKRKSKTRPITSFLLGAHPVAEIGKVSGCNTPTATFFRLWPRTIVSTCEYQANCPDPVRAWSA